MDDSMNEGTTRRFFIQRRDDAKMNACIHALGEDMGRSRGVV